MSGGGGGLSCDHIGSLSCCETTVEFAVRYDTIDLIVYMVL